MKKIILLTAVFAVSLISFAQETSQPTVRFGLEFTPIYINILNPTLDALSVENSNGVAGKLVIEKPFSDAAYLSVGIEVAQFKSDLIYNAGLIDSVSVINAKSTMVNIPVTLKLRTSQYGLFTPFGQIGFEPGLGINNDFQNTIEGIYEAGDVLFNFPISLALGTEFHLSDRNAAYASFFYRNGFTNFINDKYVAENDKLVGDSEKISLNNFGLRIGFFF